MDVQTARRLAESELAKIATPSVPLQLVDADHVVDVGWAFVFAWNSQRWFETRDRNDAVGPSAGPIVVVKTPPLAFTLASAPSVDEQLARYAVANSLPSPPPLFW
ncbi:hypothetical protein GGQ61_001277 [Phenylobacterium haematophilum]|uniref:Immunity protein 35 domain-containing protein n=1 Tax=Phenylobacterium haematophilum TaxID=98513 RepID=A0A839ZZ83_9CAUL|nr:YrhB domain-containing protein [Phenylobacterium haematophilum]MBB3890560.1 hypothetical protein [Phenylobacterium haematophilum]